MKLKHKNRWAN